MRNLSVLTAAIAVLAAVVGATSVLAATGKPDSRYLQMRDGVALHVDTSACAGFAPAGELQLLGRLNGVYEVWKTSFGNEQVGRTDLRASATIGGHVYRIKQRYLFQPRQYREYVDGWATTVVTRDDGASMSGPSWLGLGGTGAPVEGVWWQGTPTCHPATRG